MIESDTLVSTNPIFFKIFDYVSFNRKLLFLIFSVAFSVFFLFFQEAGIGTFPVSNKSLVPTTISPSEEATKSSLEEWKQCVNSSGGLPKSIEICAQQFDDIYEVSTFYSEEDVKYVIICQVGFDLTVLSANMTMDKNAIRMVQAAMMSYMTTFALDPLFTGAKIFEEQLKIFPHELKLSGGIVDSYNLTDLSYRKLILKEPALNSTYIPVNLRYFIEHLAGRDVISALWIIFNTKSEASYFLEKFLDLLKSPNMTRKICQLNLKVLEADFKLEDAVKIIVDKSKKYVLLRYHQTTSWANFYLVNFKDQECLDRYRLINY